MGCAVSGVGHLQAVEGVEVLGLRREPAGRREREAVALAVLLRCLC